MHILAICLPLSLQFVSSIQRKLPKRLVVFAVKLLPRLCICLLHIVENKELFPTLSPLSLSPSLSCVLFHLLSALLLYNYCSSRCWSCCLASKHCCELLLHIIKCYSTAYKTCQSSSPGHAYATSSLCVCVYVWVCSLCFWNIGHIVYNGVCGFIYHTAAIIIMVSN